ncbi:MAG: hypothetical protein K0M45_00320 [Candidatus Paracaedibacteraceae bacterium]|nr:hypothetical protein [Candidatus Paracaedibacteraceae bacterium]
MASTKFSVCSLALLELGLRPISSFQDQSNLEAAGICGELWDHYSSYLLSVYPWRFNMFKQRLGLLADKPINEWNYAFQQPTAMLKLHAVFESDSPGYSPYKRYELFEDKIYSDVNKLWVDYQKYVDPSKWPIYFTEFAVMALSAKLAPILTDKQDLAADKYYRAWGSPQDNLRGGLVGQAMSINSKQAPSEPITSYPLIAARFS